MPDPPRRPGWTHSDGRPYDDFDFGATRIEDEADLAEHVARIERGARSTHTVAVMFSSLRRFFARMSGGSLERGGSGADSRQRIENTDAMAAAGTRDSDPGGDLGAYTFPPKYVPPVDEGRPRH